MTTKTQQTEGGFDPAAFTKGTGIQLEQYPLDTCPRKARNGKTTYPFKGCSVWLTPLQPLGLVTAGIDLQQMERNPTRGALGFDKLKAGFAQVVAGHDMPGVPQCWQDGDALDVWATEAVFHIYQIIVTGEAPEAEGNG